MGELTADVFASIWRLARAGQTPDDPSLQAMQKYMVMHEDMHAHFDRLLDDPAAPLEVDGENLMLHIAMDAATERSLEQDEPMGIRQVMQTLLTAGVDPGRAFHVVSQAMQHAFIQGLDQGQAMDPLVFLSLAQQYSMQVRMQMIEGAGG